MKRIFLISIVLLFASSVLFAQTCVVCDDSYAITGASTIGTNNNALGGRSIILGSFSQTTAIGGFSIAIGSRVKTMAGKCVAIGSGVSSDYMLSNYMQESLMVGFNSNLSTFFVSMSEGVNRTGKVGIGNVVDQYGQMNPLAKLHLRADDGEDAAVFIQPFNWARGDEASLALGDDLNGISAVYEKGLFFKTQSFYNFNEGYIRIGLEARPGSVLVCADDKGTARWVQIEPPTPSPWLSTESGDIYFDKGKVGIGTINTTPYALAVKGYIITDEVMVKHHDMWPDFVFKPGFSLKSLAEVEQYISENNHLPDVPSAKEVDENGFAVGEMNAILLQKIEELTLYIIDQEKRLQTQQQQMDLQQAEFKALKNVIEQQHINKD